MLQREAACTCNVFDADEKRNIGVSKRDALEVVVVGCHHVEEGLTARTVEDHLTVTGGFYHDRLVRRSALGQVVSAVEKISHGQITRPRRSVHVMKTIADVEAG